MSFNIMDMVTSQITPDNIKLVAGMLGEDEGKVSSGVSGAIPAILGGLVSSFSKPDGQQAFETQLSDADPGLFGNLAGVLGGGDNGSALVKTGAGMLGSLFGESKMGMLTSAIASFSGLSKGSSSSLLGLAAPLLLSMLKGKGDKDGLSAGGIVDMLMGQKDNIAKALPSDLGSALSASGLMDGVMDNASEAVSQAASATAAAGQEAADKGGSLLGKLLPFIVVALVAWVAYQFLMKPAPQEPAAPGGAVQLQNQLGGLMSKASGILAGIDSVDDAKNAVPELQAVDQGLGQILSAADSLPPGQLQQLAGQFSKLAPGLEQAIGHAYGVPGARDVLASTVDSMLRKLKVLSSG